MAAAPPRQILKQSVRQLAIELKKKGLVDDHAWRFARLILSRPGVVVGRKGNIQYKGKLFTPQEFATSSLSEFVTGKKAEKQNQAAILGDPGYMSTLAQLGLGRDTGLADVADERLRSVLEFGDPNFAGDPLLAGQTSANPFSTIKLLQKQYEGEQGAVRQTANRAGTLFGGGLESGMGEAARTNALRVTEGTKTLEQLLAGLSRRSGELNQNYDIGRAGALQDTTQRLLQSGIIHAAAPPVLKVRPFTFGKRRRKIGLW
jgi:hypothetical protein